MKLKTISIAVVMLSLGVGVGYSLSRFDLNESKASGAEKQEKKILYWAAPMDPNFRSEKPGKSPMGMDLIPVFAEEGPGADDGKDEKALKISAAVVNNLGVRTSKAKKQTLSQMINTVGFVTPDDDMTRDIHVRTEGWIEKLVVKTEGERVKKGDLLFQFYSRELSNAQAEYIQALAIKQSELARASLSRLEALGMSERQIGELKVNRKINNLVDVYTPQAGYVVKLNVREGMFIQPKTTVFRLADMSSVWIMAEIYEYQAGKVARGQKAEMRLPFLPGKVWEGSVDYVYPTVDPQSRTIRVRLRFNNPGEQLKPNMYSEVTIHGTAKEDVITIPREALIRTGKSERVILALGEGRFRPAQVVSGMESGDQIEIVVGLQKGETVVTSGQFLLDSEASLDASLLRMTDAVGNAEAEDVAPIPISAQGVVDSIKADVRKLNITHQPIAAIGWPNMTMDFRVGQDVDIDSLKVGDSIGFTLKKDEAVGDYVVQSVSKGSSN